MLGMVFRAWMVDGKGGETIGCWIVVSCDGL